MLAQHQLLPTLSSVSLLLRDLSSQSELNPFYATLKHIHQVLYGMDLDDEYDLIQQNVPTDQNTDSTFFNFVPEDAFDLTHSPPVANVHVGLVQMDADPDLEPETVPAPPLVIVLPVCVNLTMNTDRVDQVFIAEPVAVSEEKKTIKPELKNLTIPDAEFRCSHCFRGFSTKFSFKRHRKTHTGERPYFCGICPKRFAEKAQLKRHTLIHSGVKPFKCLLCPKSFKDLANLKRHEGIHIQIKG